MSAPGTKYASVTSLQMSVFVASNAESCEVFHSNSASFFKKSLNVAVGAETFGVKGDMYMTQSIRTPSVLSHSSESSSVGWFRSVLGLGAHRQHHSQDQII